MPGDKSEPSTFELPTAVKAALIDLDRWVRPRPELEPIGQRIVCILKIAFGIPGSPLPSLLPGTDQTSFLLERIKEGWKHGADAVRVVRPQIDRDRLIQRMRALVACTEHEYSPAPRFRETLCSKPESIADWVIGSLLDDDEALPPEIHDGWAPLDYPHSILRMTLLAELGEWSDRICAHLSDRDWGRLNCPVCGALPALAESRGLEQRRYLRCGRCGAGWPSNRLQCPFCGEDNPRRLIYLVAEEDQHRCRLVLCEGCGGRLKVITTLAPLSAPGLILAEFTMLYFDELDRNEGIRIPIDGSRASLRT
jgi:FdhE protein